MNSGMNLHRVLPVAVLLPAAIVLVDQWSLSGHEIEQPSLFRALTIYAFLSVRSGSWDGSSVAALHIRLSVAAVYVWGITLVDMSCYRIAIDDSRTGGLMG